MAEFHKINLQPISDEDIAAHNISLADLWMIQLPDNILYGPFTTKTLKEYSSNNFEIFQEAHSYNLEDESWKPFFSTPPFQRRRPRLVPTQSLISNDNFHILQKGKKHGPFSLQELKEMVSKSDINLNAQVSIDNGETWIKLYEHHEFDRRTRSSHRESLPFIPQDEIFKNVQEDTQKALQRMKKLKDQEDALVGLAFIGHGNDKGQLFDSTTNKGEVNPDNVETDDLANYRNDGPGLWQNFKDKSKDFVIQYPKLTAMFLTFCIISLAWLNQAPSNQRDIASEFKQSQKIKSVVNSGENSDVNSQEQKDATADNKAKRITARKSIIRRPKKLERPEVRPFNNSQNEFATNRNTKNRRSKYSRNNARVDEDEYNDNYPNDLNNENDLVNEKYERYDEMVDVDDPRVKEELNRELAGKYMPELDGEIPVSKDFVEQFENGEISPEVEAELERRIEHYEEVSDF